MKISDFIRRPTQPMAWNPYFYHAMVEESILAGLYLDVPFLDRLGNGMLTVYIDPIHAYMMGGEI